MSEPVSKTYADVPDTEQFLKPPVVEAFLDFLPPQRRSKFVAGYCELLDTNELEAMRQTWKRCLDAEANPGPRRRDVPEVER